MCKKSRETENVSTGLLCSFLLFGFGLESLFLFVLIGWLVGFLFGWFGGFRSFVVCMWGVYFVVFICLFFPPLFLFHCTVGPRYPHLFGSL